MVFYMLLYNSMRKASATALLLGISSGQNLTSGGILQNLDSEGGIGTYGNWCGGGHGGIHFRIVAMAAPVHRVTGRKEPPLPRVTPSVPP